MLSYHINAHDENIEDKGLEDASEELLKVEAFTVNANTGYYARDTVHKENEEYYEYHIGNRCQIGQKNADQSYQKRLE